MSQCHNVEVKQIDLNSNIRYGACQSYTGNVNPQHLVSIKKHFWVAYPDSVTGPAGTDGNLTEYSHKGKFEAQVYSVNSPRGVVQNCSSRFGGYKLLVDTEEGTIEGYNPAVNLTNTVQILQSTGAFYTDIDISKDKVFASNFATGSVDVYNGTSVPFVALASIADPDLLLNNYHAYAVAVYQKHLYVAYAQNLNGVNTPSETEGSGYINVFKLDGTCMKRLVNRTGLNAPSDIIVSDCGCYLYVSNKGDGTISIYERKCGTYLGKFKDCCQNKLVIDNLNGLAFKCNDIAFTAGSPTGATEVAIGLLGVLTNCCEKKCHKSSSSSSSSSKCCKK